MKITIVIDMQNDFIDGVLGSADARKITPLIADEIRKGTSDVYVFTQDVHGKQKKRVTVRLDAADSIEAKTLPGHCISGTKGCDIAAPIEKEILNLQNKGKAYVAKFAKTTFCDPKWFPEFLMVCKNRKATENTSSIRSQEIDNSDEIEIFGLCTDICVISNALVLRSAFPSTSITVRSSLCAGVTPEKHSAALEVMRSCLIDVVE